jgi:predicted dehydrogenase
MASNNPISRRDLIKAVSITAASYARINGANDRAQIAFIGQGARGSELRDVFQKLDGIRITALCDIYGTRLEKARASAPGAAPIHDYRQLLDRKDVDAVVIATPDHWHATMAIDSLRAGKDVYVEKPLTFRMEEGPRIVKAARLANRICAVGTQQRSGPHYQRAKEEFIKRGKLGNITLVRTWWHDGGASGSIGGHRTPPEAKNRKPDDIDWPAFVGPAKWREWNDRQFFDFRSYLDLSGGVLGDKFVHWIDTVHMFLEQDDPIAASMIGGVFRYRDGRTAPDTVNLAVQYRGNWLATFEHGHITSGVRAGIEFHGGDGRLFITRDQFEFYSAEKGAPPVIVKAERDQTIDHAQNFLNCIRSRQTPNCDVHAGHRSAQAAHLGNLSYEQGRRINFDPDLELVL